MIGRKAVEGALRFAETNFLPEPEQRRLAEARREYVTRTADGDAQGAVPSLRAMVTLREGADGAAKAEREDAIGPDAPDLPYFDKAQQAKDIIAAWKATTRQAEHLAKTTKRAELSDTFTTTPPVFLAKYKDDPAPETPPAQLAAPQSTERRPQLLKGKATPQGAPIRLAQGGPVRTDVPVKGDGFSSAAPSASPPSPLLPEDEPGDTMVEFAADSVDAHGKRHKATKRVVLSRLRSAALEAFAKEWRRDWSDLFPDKIFAPGRITELLKDRHFLNAAYARLRDFDAMRGVVRFEAEKENAAALDGEPWRSGRTMALTNWIDDPAERRRFSAWLRREKPELFEGDFAGGALAEDRALFRLSDQDYVRFAAETALAERLQIASLNTLFQEHLARAQGVGDAVGETVMGVADLAQTAASGLRGAVLDNPSLGGASSALRGRNFALLMAYSSAAVEAKATRGDLEEIRQRDVKNWRGFEKAAQAGAQRLATFANAPLEEQLSTLGELGQAGAKALIGELTRLANGPADRAERERALRKQWRSGAINQSDYLQGLRAITKEAAADAILVLEIGVPGSKVFRAAKALKLLQARRRGGDGPDDFGDFGGMVPVTAGGPGGPLGRGPDRETKGGHVHPMAPQGFDGRPAKRDDPIINEDLAEARKHEPLEAFRRRMEKIPFIRDGFDGWVDGQSPTDVLRLWTDTKDLWRTVTKRIRSTGKLHEWHMVTMLPDLRKLGVPMAEIRGIDFRSPTGTLRVKDPDTGKIYSHLEGTQGGEARATLDKFHAKLRREIAKAAGEGDREMLDRAFRDLAVEWLPGGVADLPPGLRERIRRLRD